LEDESMILDALAEWRRYASVHPDFPRAFEFLQRPDLASLAPGRHAVDGDRVYVLIDDRSGRGREGARLEAHRAYLDVQLTIEGHEEIGWRPLAGCQRPAGAFDTSRDIGLFDDRPDTWLAVPPGQFAVFFPSDAHAPLGGHGALRKAIVKVAVRA
jgi:YhcH/YjgK/YiaL family protein